MTDNEFKALLIEDNPLDVRLIQEELQEETGGNFTLRVANSLAAGLVCLADGGIDVILLDLSLPDSLGLDTLLEVRSMAPEIPIVVLTGFDDKKLAIDAVKAGAQDYLVKGKIAGDLLVRSIRYAIERYRFQAALRDLLLIDDLTGLYNRRGFMTFARQQLKLADRTQRGLLLIIADLDGMKQINDNYGHQEGDRALKETARILKNTFRESDLVARIGGDEFAIVAIGAGEDSNEKIYKRMQKNLDAFNSRKKQRFHLSISIGIAPYKPGDSCEIEDLMAKADERMYEQKRAKYDASRPGGNR